MTHVDVGVVWTDKEKGSFILLLAYRKKVQKERVRYMLTSGVSGLRGIAASWEREGDKPIF